MTKLIRKRNKLEQFRKISLWEKSSTKKLFSKTFLMFLFVAFSWFGLHSIKDTQSYYGDTEASSGNSFTSGQVDFTLTNSEFLPVTSALNLTVGDTATKEITIDAGASNPFKYVVEGKNFTGDIDYCNGLNAKLDLGSTEAYNGSLSALLTSPTQTLDTWKLSLSTSTPFENKICDFDTEFRGSQTRHDYPLMQGYSDTETVGHHISSWGFRINKIYYDVDDAHGSEGDNEWVEIYNQTDTALDLSGWQICDNEACDTIPANTPLIPAKGFGVITAKDTTWQYWNIPSDVVKIVLENNIGNGLANGGDRLILKRPDGAIIDQMNWKTDTGVWNPGAVDVGEGHMLGRKPNGYDTDQPSDFVDLSLPIVLLTNPDQSGTLTWYWTYFYDILWTATNPNGDNSNLKIDLYYIKDLDGSGTITPADETVTIATGLDNSGTYSWQLPSGFIGYIWIKIVATGGENPMLNSQMISGKIWDPFPAEMWSIDPELVMESIEETKAPAEILTTILPILPSGISTTLESSIQTEQKEEEKADVPAEKTEETQKEIATEEVTENTPEIVPTENTETASADPEIKDPEIKKDENTETQNTENNTEVKQETVSESETQP